LSATWTTTCRQADPRISPRLVRVMRRPLSLSAAAAAA
jgi:hypothetical protein